MSEANRIPVHVPQACGEPRCHRDRVEAACLMTGANCGSVLIVEPPGKLLGIVTERDLMTRVLAKALPPDRTLVSK